MANSDLRGRPQLALAHLARCQVSHELASRHFTKKGDKFFDIQAVNDKGRRGITMNGAVARNGGANRLNGV